jgi:hypothetical protein
MISLLRNCSHGSEIALYILEDHEKKQILKTSYSLSGIDDLKREKSGWEWYQKTLFPLNIEPIFTEFKTHTQFACLTLRYCNAQKGMYYKGLDKTNQLFIQLFFNWYIQHWPKPAELCPMHGDLSIDNLLFEKTTPIILDWEHFNVSAAPWGFDALYLLFETHWFGRKSMQSDAIFFLHSMITQLTESGKLDPQWANAPLENTIRFIRNNLTLWGTQLEVFESKLPILTYADTEAKAIDLAVKNYPLHN